MCNGEKYVKEYSHGDDRGHVQAMVYRPFPGVEVAFASVHMAEFDFGFWEQGNEERDVTIHYCKEGRMEQQTQEEFFYLMPGDCAFDAHQKQQKLFQLPLKHYQGICITMDLERMENPLLAYLHSCGCSPDDVLGQRSCVVLRSSEGAKKFFEDLDTVESEQKLHYLRVKIPELFYRIKCAKTDSSYYDRDLVPRYQVEIVQSASDYILKNLNRKITVKQLTRHFGVSDTYLQNAFRSVYGMPVIRFIRMQKMQRAAQVLIHTTRTIDEIAEEFGYENESKFATAFKKIMGESPGAYRKARSKVKIP